MDYFSRFYTPDNSTWVGNLKFKLPGRSVHQKTINISSEDEKQGSGDSGSEGDESERDEQEKVSDTSDIEIEDRFSDAVFVTPKSQRIKTFEDTEDWSPPSARTAFCFLDATPSRRSRKYRSFKPTSDTSALPKSIAKTKTKQSVKGKQPEYAKNAPPKRKRSAHSQKPTSESEPTDPKPKRARSHRRSHPKEVASPEANDNTDENLVTVPKKRGRPPKVPKREPSKPLPLAVSLYTEVEMPKVVQHGKTAKGTKLVAQPNLVDGPRTLDLDTNWGGFIDITCATVKCTRDQLVLSSLWWAWATLKGTSKQKSPITTASGYEQMIKSIKNMADKERNTGMVHIYMAMPKPLEENNHSRVCQYSIAHDRWIEDCIEALELWTWTFTCNNQYWIRTNGWPRISHWTEGMLIHHFFKAISHKSIRKP